MAERIQPKPGKSPSYSAEYAPMQFQLFVNQSSIVDTMAAYDKQMWYWPSCPRIFWTQR